MHARHIGGHFSLPYSPVIIAPKARSLPWL